MLEENIFTVGSRVLIRDAEWRILRVDLAKRGYKLTCQGLSTLVRGKEFEFFTIFEDPIEVLRPEDTVLVIDTSEGFRDTKLFLEAMLRTSPISDNDKITIANRAAIDSMPYQFNPALQALKQSRARILIADAVGIGKTMEAGILASELIRRGRGRRILVLTVKSVLDQFQQEFWNRFSIPLMPLDSENIRSIQNKIPQNHNPLLYFDRAIISIDTLKNNARYAEYIKNAYWDIIIIDEAHNVAERSRSQRSQLAKLLANQSDSLIMLTATPHDGTAKSFASLLNLLDPTVIADPEHYTVTDYASKGLVIRRFKNDVDSQVKKKFPKRITNQIDIEAGPEEKEVYEKLKTFLSQTYDNNKARGIRLFSTLLTKAMFSSPESCKSVIANRLETLNAQKQKLEEKSKKGCPAKSNPGVKAILSPSLESAPEINPKDSDPLLTYGANTSPISNYTAKDSNSKPVSKPANKKQIPEEKIKAIDIDIKNLTELQKLVEKVTPDKWTKLDCLIEMLNPDKKTDGWNPQAYDDRVVIFTESIPTLGLLRKELPKRSGLKENQIICMSGDMTDVDLTSCLRKFNDPKEEARVLICSDVASEGINLHHLSHRLIHFDIPWSLMTFQQRNGRIDRYGQEKEPHIQYLQTVCGETQVMQFVDVLKKLTEKDKQAHENLSDPLEFSLSEKQQVEHTAAEGEGHGNEWKEELKKEQESTEDDLDEWFSSASEEAQEEWFPSEGTSQSNTDDVKEDQATISPVLTEEEFKKDLLKEPSLFRSDFDFVSRVLNKVASEEKWPGVHIDPTEKQISFLPPEKSDLRTRLKYLPTQILPKGGRFFLTSDPKEVMDEMEHARRVDEPWPTKQLLWPLHPVTEWAVDKGLTQFGRHKAPLVPLANLAKEETWYLLQGGFPNMRGYTPVHAWIAVREVNGNLSTHTMWEFLEKTKFDKEVTNYSNYQLPDLNTFKESLGKAVRLAETELEELRKKFENNSKQDLLNKIEDLQRLEEKRKRTLDKALDFAKTQVGSKKESSFEASETASSENGGNSELPESGKQFQPPEQSIKCTTKDSINLVEIQKGPTTQQKSSEEGISRIGNSSRKRSILIKEQKLAEIRETFKDAQDYLEKTANLEDKPYLQLAAVFTGIKNVDISIPN